jgi:SAM-dependent methyltransferase
MPIHDAAARGFERAVGDYERGRPGFPPDAVRAVVEALGIGPGKRVLDLAAGSGKFTRELVPTGAEITAVEPVRSMREALAAALPSVRTLDGTAESIPADDASFNAVTAAQAFHWFDGDRALAEIHRVLVPEGRLALVWNVRDERDPLMRGATGILERYRGDTPSYGSMAWREAFERTTLFTPLEERRFGYVQETDVDGFVARFASVSFVAALPHEERERVLGELRALAGDREPVRLPYVTNVFWCTRV